MNRKKQRHLYIKSSILPFDPCWTSLEPFQDGSIPCKRCQGVAPGHGWNAGRAFVSSFQVSERGHLFFVWKSNQFFGGGVSTLIRYNKWRQIFYTPQKDKMYIYVASLVSFYDGWIFLLPKPNPAVCIIPSWAFCHTEVPVVCGFFRHEILAQRPRRFRGDSLDGLGPWWGGFSVWFRWLLMAMWNKSMMLGQWIFSGSNVKGGR